MYRYSIDRPTYVKPLSVLIAFCALALFLAGCTTGTDVPDPSTGSVSLDEVDDQEIGQPEMASAYFSRTQDAADCSLVSPVQRELDTDTEDAEAVADALLESLLAGPTAEERAQGYTSFFSDQTDGSLRDVIIQNGTAYVDLEDLRQVIPNASSSCGSAQLLAQVTQTLRQVPGVSRVILAFDGSVRSFYDWIQLGCSAENDNCDSSVFGGAPAASSASVAP